MHKIKHAAAAIIISYTHDAILETERTEKTCGVCYNTLFYSLYTHLKYAKLNNMLTQNLLYNIAIHVLLHSLDPAYG